MRRVIRAAPVVVALALATRVAAADDAGTADVASLEKQLDDERVALSTSDCSVACRALASIRRAAERICTLEPGTRCDAARTKEREATRRVREACPDCALAFAPEPKQINDAPATAAPPPPQPASAESRMAPRERGGCRSCTAAAAGGELAGDLGVFVFAALALARLQRRRRRR